VAAIAARRGAGSSRHRPIMARDGNGDKDHPECPLYPALYPAAMN
jgi:hypothetical protein